MNEKRINKNFNDAVLNKQQSAKKVASQNTAVKQQSASPALNMTPPASKKSMQNQVAMDTGHSQREKQKRAEQDKTNSAPKNSKSDFAKAAGNTKNNDKKPDITKNKTNVSAKQDFAKQAKVNTQNFNQAAKQTQTKTK